jgi:hypothetical protein
MLHPGSKRSMRLEGSQGWCWCLSHTVQPMVEDPGGDSIASNEPRGLPLLHLRVEEVSNLTAGVIRQSSASFFLEFPAAVKDLQKPIWSKVTLQIECTVRGRKAGVEC